MAECQNPTVEFRMTKKRTSRQVPKPEETVVSDILRHIPHASALIPPNERGRFSLTDSDLDRELLTVTDWFTDDLFTQEGSERLVFGVSRLLVDPERFADDAQEVMSARGLGAVYTSTHDGRPLKSATDRDALLAQYYHPHHQALNAWAARAMETHGRCLIIDCHSFPSAPLPCDLDQTPDRPDFCIGAVTGHTPDKLVEAVTDAIKNLTPRRKRTTYSVLVNRPYEGSIVPSAYYGRDPRVCSIMIEVRRGLYMDEHTGERSANYEALKAAVTSVLQSIAAAWADDAVAHEIWDHADTDLRLEPVKRVFEGAAIGTIVQALSEMEGEDSWNIPERLLLTAALREAPPGIRQLSEYLSDNGAVPMYTSDWVVSVVKKKLAPYEMTSSLGERHVGAGDYAVKVTTYYVPDHGVFRVEYVGGDEMELQGVQLGKLTRAEAEAWISETAGDGEEWDEEEEEDEEDEDDEDDEDEEETEDAG